MEFTKWNGCGNDFVFINAMNSSIDPILAECSVICDRHFGIGADGIIFILPSDVADFRMRIFNCDGSEAEMCGNGIRCFTKLVRELGLTDKKAFPVETGAGILVPELLDDGNVRVDMGKPRLEATEIPIRGYGDAPVIARPLHNERDGRDYFITCVSMGNPHCVILTDDAESVDLAHIGPQLEINPHFPQKTNVEFLQKIDGHTLRMRVWERGAAITLACGTGSCAALTAAVLNGLVKEEADILLDGGKVHVRWDREGSGHLFLTGPADKVFEGTYLLKGEK